jgi:hypothetical protein
MAEHSVTLTRHDLEAKIVRHCWEDEGFRNEFTTDPVGTAVKYLQVPAASLPKIVVHQEMAGAWHIILPAKPADADELSEEDLEKVAGGTTPTLAISAAVSIGAVVSAASAGISGSVSVTLNEGW